MSMSTIMPVETPPFNLGEPDTKKDFWDPALYRQSALMQRRWVATLFEKINLENRHNILDVGCGDGEITSQLAKENEHRQVLGLDISQKMIDFAKESFPKNFFKNLEFICGCAEQMSFYSQFDTVVSLNTLQRVKNPKIALNKIFNALKPGGLFAAVFPALKSKILTDSIAAVDTKEEWAQYFKNPERKEYKNTEKLYHSYLNSIGFQVKKVQIIYEDEIFPNRQAFFDILKACFNQRDNLPIEKQDDFFNQVMEEYLNFMPLDHEKRVHFYYNRMEIIAFKPFDR